VEGSHRQRQPAGRQLDHAGAGHRRSRHGGHQGRPHRSIQVDARGEVAELKDNLQRHDPKPARHHEQNTEQDWLKTNLAKFTGMLQGQRDLVTVGKLLLSELVPLVRCPSRRALQHGFGRHAQPADVGELCRRPGARLSPTTHAGNGVPRQCAVTKSRILVTDVPLDTVKIGSSALFKALPRSLVVFPVVFEGRTKAVLGLASLRDFSAAHLAFLEQLTANIGIVFNSIEATMQTEGLLQQSQKLATELQTQQKELQQTNEQLAQKAQQLAEQTPKWNARTTRSSKPGTRWKRRPPNWP